MADLTFWFVESPLPAYAARRASDFVGRFLKEEYLHSMLRGEFSGSARFIAGLGFAGDELVGTCWTGWGEGFPDIGVMGGVATSEAHRGRGVATALVKGACERFDAAGGRLLYLGTLNPVALRIYEGAGFRPLASPRQSSEGQLIVLCRAASGAAPDEGFAPGRKVAARLASWRDMAAVAPLYLLPHPCLLADAVAALPSCRVAAPRRCVGIFWRLWKSVEQGGRWNVLQNESGWIVASALARPDRPLSPASAEERVAGGPGGFSVDFFWHPDYAAEAASFVAEWLEEVEAASGRPCGMLVCEGDDWKMSEARKLGFERLAAAGGAAELDGRKVPLLRLKRRVH